MQYTKTCKEALVLSCQNGCVVWADTGGTIFDIDTMVEFAEIADAEHPTGEDQFYAISIEGAIGIIDQYEFNLQWFFYPVLDEEVKEKYRKAIQDDLNKQDQKTAKQRFCPHCGARINPGAKFCPECGGKQ